MREKADQKWLGVNLGGWLVLEKWLAPTLFQGLKAGDEQSFCLELNDQAEDKLSEHRKSYITEADFKWIAKHGLNSVRIPVGYWIFGDAKPFVGGINTLDFAFESAKENGLGVVIDLHAAPGSQNGWDHSGQAGEVRWHQDPQNIVKTLEAVRRLAERYAKKTNLLGIELLNEPRWDVPFDILVDFYKKGYQLVRGYCDEDVAVIISDAFRSQEWQGVFSGSGYKNIILDSHYYQCFSDEDKRLDIKGHLRKTEEEIKNQIGKSDLPVVVGEWSLGLDPGSLTGLNEQEQGQALKDYGEAQMVTFSRSKGWFFWTYKTEDMAGWSLKDCVKNGWLPESFK